MIEQDLAEAYFESNGFWVRPLKVMPKKSSRKKYEYLPVITVMNPLVTENILGQNPRLFTGDLKKIRSATVAILGWSNSNFSHAELTSDAKLFKFLNHEINPQRIDDSFLCHTDESGLGIGSDLRILVVPALPIGAERMRKFITKIKDLRIAGVLTLRSILENLLWQAPMIDPMNDRDVFQFLHLMRAYDLSKNPQLEIFPKD